MKKLYETPHSQQDSWQLSDTIQIGEYYNFAVILQAKTAAGGTDRYIAIDDVNFANQCGYGKFLQDNSFWPFASYIS